MHDKNPKKPALVALGSQEQHIDPRPDTVMRTSSPAYKAGQLLILLHEKRLVDAVVEHWFGPRCGSRHRVRLGDKGKKLTGKPGGGGKGKGDDNNLVELDLNEENHAKLVLPSVAKYESARSALLEALVAEYAIVYDNIADLHVRAADQRLYLKKKDLIVAAAAEEKAAEASEEEAAAADAAGERKRRMSLGSAAGTPRTSSPSGARAKAPAGAEAAVAAPPEVDDSENALKLVQDLITPVSHEVAATTPQHLFVRTRTKAEHDLLQAQALCALAATLISEQATGGARSERRHVPVCLPISTLVAIMNDESKRTNARDMILQSFAAAYPKRADATVSGDVLRQAIELRALVIIADVRTEADLQALRSESVLEELLMNKLLLIIDEDVISTSPELPSYLLERSRLLQVHTWGCFMNDARLNNHACKQLLLQMKPNPSGLASHYERVSVLHISTATINKDTQLELETMLKLKTCNIRYLDISNTQVDGSALATALSSNVSLRSLDVRMVPKMAESFETIGSMLLKPESTSRLAYLRCDAFEVLEGETVLTLRERPMGKGAMRLLSGLLRNNKEVIELDLSATNLHKESAMTLVETFCATPSTPITAVHLTYNPAIDKDVQKELLAALAKEGMKIALNF